ncbi:hypothetical protein SKAU_G00345230 [Synaphobranchus kaupii]|uniref:Ephrin-B3 n=1 Tax=Synaphobranchus kaupii TaxID=118154 RepID=A0A9Q1EJG1_SYNKA|nr:hypothetical protein SKAU_G00345230 [Synaphobranchus kaupii]
MVVWGTIGGYVLYPQIGDRLDLICPASLPGGPRASPEYEFYKLYLLHTREEANRCEVIDDSNLLLTCDKPHSHTRFTIKFQEFSPNLWGHEFHTQRDYYIIATSDGTRQGLDSLRGGVCVTRGMKVVLKVGQTPYGLPLKPPKPDPNSGRPKNTGSFAGRAKIEGGHSDPVQSQAERFGRLSLRVPPHTPQCEIPSTALTGAMVEMRCRDKISFPPATYKWYKDNQPLSSARQHNLTYTLDTQSGTLYFRTVSQADSGKYRCEASNGVGAPKSCEGTHFKIDDMNMLIIITVGAGSFLFLCVCVLGICYCCWRRCCKRQKRSSDTPHRSSSSSLPNPQYYRHTQSFVL